MRYRIIASFVDDDGTVHSLRWGSAMLTTKDEVGLEYKKGLVLNLSAEKVALWRNQSNSANDAVPLTVAVGDISEDVLQTYLQFDH